MKNSAANKQITETLKCKTTEFQNKAKVCFWNLASLFLDLGVYVVGGDGRCWGW